MNQSDFLKCLKENYDYEIYDDENEFLLQESDIKIQVMEDNKFNIFRNFCYSINNNNEDFSNEILEALEKNTIKALTLCFDQKPETVFECGMGCPFDTNLVGYWDKPFDIGFLDLFIETCNNAEEQVNDDSIYKRIIERIIETIDDEDFTLTQWLIKSKDSSVIVSTNNSKYDKSIFDYTLCTTLDSYYVGVHYFIGQNKNLDQKIYVDVNNYSWCLSLIGKLNIFDEVKIVSDYKKVIILETAHFYCVISLLQTMEDLETIEYNYLCEKLRSLKIFNPKTNLPELNFEGLSPADFEQLCYDLLNELKFTDIHPVGKTNAPDGGKDLLAQENISTLLSNETRLWIWQCKHSKKSLEKKDIAEIDDLLIENHATHYGLFCSNDLTPGTVERLNSKNQRCNGCIKFYGKKEMETLLSKFPQLIQKFKLLG